MYSKWCCGRSKIQNQRVVFTELLLSEYSQLRRIGCVKSAHHTCIVPTVNLYPFKSVHLSLPIGK